MELKVILTIMICVLMIGCGKPSQSVPIPSDNSASPEVSLRDPSAEVCEQIRTSPESNYAIILDDEVLILEKSKGYIWDLGLDEIIPLETSQKRLGTYCEVSFVKGTVNDVTDIPAVVPKICGGAFQPSCPQVQPTPYICGPQWQFCY